MGHGRYITDTIHITPEIGEPLQAGQPIGEIVIGSLYELHFRVPRRTYVTVGRGDHVVGGATVIAKLIELK